MAELIQSELDISGRLGRKRQGLGLALSAILSAGDRHRRARKDFSKNRPGWPYMRMFKHLCNSRGGAQNTLAALVITRRRVVGSKPPSGPCWARMS